MLNLEQVWDNLQSYEGNGAKNFQFFEYRVQFYKGAMEIPLIAFFPKIPFNLSDEKMQNFSSALSEFGLELDCVEEKANYKINRAEDKQYIGRLTTDSLKLHAVRIKELGWETFSKIIFFCLNGELL